MSSLLFCNKSFQFYYSGAQTREARQRSGAPWVKFNLGYLSMREILVKTSRRSARTDCRGGGGEVGQPLGTGVFWQFSLAGDHVPRCISNPRFSGGKSY